MYLSDLRKLYIRKKTSDAFTTILLFAGSMLLLFPLYWMIICSFMSDADVSRIPPLFFPKTLYLNNYRELFIKAPTIRWFFNSVYISSITTLAILVISTMAGYSFAKGEYKFRNVIFLCMAFTIMIPKQILLIPLFGIIRDLKMINTYRGVIIPDLGWPFGVFLMRQYIITIPNELINSAEIDGCSEIGIFWRIIVPLSKPGMGALAIFTFIQSWNSYMWQLLVISTKALKTLPLGISTFQEEFSARNGLLMAGAVIASLPMVLVFLKFQNYFTKGITAGAVKG